MIVRLSDHRGLVEYPPAAYSGAVAKLPIISEQVEI